MSDELPLTEAAVAGLLAAVAATIVTVLIERCGGLVGGVLGTTPSTILPAAIGIAAATTNPDMLRAAMYTVPLAMGCDVLLLAAWRVLPPWLPDNLSIATQAAVLAAASLVVWAVPAALVWLLTSQWLQSVAAVQAAGVIALAATAGLGLASSVHLPPTPPGAGRVGAPVLLARGLGAGLSIFSAVLGAAASPALSGLLAAFPAIFLTTMVSVYLAQGRETTVGAVAPMMLGSTSVSVFAILFAETHPALGPAAAAATAYAIAIAIASVPTTVWLRWRQAQTEGFQSLDIATADGEAEPRDDDGLPVDGAPTFELSHAGASL